MVDVQVGDGSASERALHAKEALRKLGVIEGIGVIGSLLTDIKDQQTAKPGRLDQVRI